MGLFTELSHAHKCNGDPESASKMNHKSISLLCFRCLALAGLILPTYSSLSSLGDPAGLGSRSLPATPPRHEASKVLRRREAVDPLVDQQIRFSDSVETAISGLEKGGQLLVHARVEVRYVNWRFFQLFSKWSEQA